MNNSQIYRIRNRNSSILNFYFDRITSLFIKSKPSNILNPKKILFIRNDHLGDMVYSLSAFKAVKKKYPDAKISVIATASNRDFIEKDKNVDEIIEIDLFWRRISLKAWLDYIKVFRKIRKENFDVGIDLRRSIFNLLFLLYFPNVKNRISYYNINCGKAFLTHPLEYKERMHVIKEHIQTVNQAFNLNVKDFMPKISVSKEDIKEKNDFIKKNNIRKYVVFAPGATLESKKWPAEKFKDLIINFHKKYPSHKIVLTGAKSDSNLLNWLANSGKEFCVPLINFNLRSLSIIFRNADLVVANDGVATDITWVSGGRLVELSGPVDRDIWGPFKNTKIIYHELKDKKDNNPYNYGKELMALITVDEVMDAINNFMKKR